MFPARFPALVRAGVSHEVLAALMFLCTVDKPKAAALAWCATRTNVRNADSWVGRGVRERLSDLGYRFPVDASRRVPAGPARRRRPGLAPRDCGLVLPAAPPSGPGTAVDAPARAARYRRWIRCHHRLRRLGRPGRATKSRKRGGLLQGCDR